ncbi:MAG: hypothetical protein ACE5G8_10615 [Anaerolineae bacterium]
MPLAKLGRIIATAVAISVGVVVLLSYFVQRFNNLGAVILGWAAVVIAFSLLLGVINLLRVHINQIQTRQRGWFYSAILIISLAITLIIGRDGPASPGGQSLFEYVLRPLEATLFALMAFFVASAAYRAFRIKNIETFLFVAFAIIVLLGQVPAGFQLWPDLPLIKEWVMRVPALAGARGILLGVALGTIATGLRVLLGADRPYADTD